MQYRYADKVKRSAASDRCGANNWQVEGLPRTPGLRKPEVGGTGEEIQEGKNTKRTEQKTNIVVVLIIVRMVVGLIVCVWS